MKSSEPSPERWRAIRSIVESALELEGGERRAFLDAECGADEDLRRAVESLLSREAETESAESNFLEPPLRDAAPRVLSLFSAAGAVGERIGAYRLTDVIGVGGMGAVYRAVRDDEAFEREVAVKLVRRGFLGEGALEAFHRERRLLARLDHPGITRLLDGGATKDGSPYIVMELVHGQPIDAYCGKSDLPLSSRLALFRAACAAVHHAHGCLVVHRDLKPSNVLVTSEGAVKLIDFGIAGIFGRDSALAALTPRYASPEVRSGDALVGTAADVYSLGVLLADLLGGEAAPPDGGGAGAVAAIAAKASDPDPARRYASAAELADDVARYERGFPVAALPVSAGRRLAMAARRHRGAVAAVALAFLVVSGFAVTASILATRLEREKAEAIGARRVAERVAAFLGDTFAVASPRRLGAEAKVLEALADAASRVDAELSDAPAVASGVHAAIGRTYAGLGFGVIAEPHLRSALRLAVLAYGDRSVETAAAMERLSVTLAYLDREESVTLAEGALERFREAAGDADPRVAGAVHGVAFALYRGSKPPRFEDAARRIEEAIERYRRLSGGEDGLDVARAFHMYGALRLRSGDAAASDAHYRTAIAIYERLGLAQEPQVVDCRVDHAICLVRLGRFDEARAAIEAAAEPLRRMYGEPGAVSVLAALSEVELERGDAAAALRLAREAFLRIGAHLAPTKGAGDETGDETDEARLRRLSGCAAAAERASPEYSTALSALGAALAASGRAAEAVPFLREAVRLRGEALPEGDWRTACARSELGSALAAAGMTGEGRVLLAASLEALERSLGGGHWETRAAARRLEAASRE